jgi:hypothetical protein
MSKRAKQLPKTSGQSYGMPRTYEELARDVIRIVQQQADLQPYTGNGIGISFPICGTDVTFDVVLKDTNGGLRVFECKRWQTENVKQELIFAFAYRLECLRSHLGVNAVGIYVTARNFQTGAIKAATYAGIEAVILRADQSASATFGINYRRYNSISGEFIQDALVYIGAPVQLTISPGQPQITT